MPYMQQVRAWAVACLWGRLCPVAESLASAIAVGYKVSHTEPRGVQAGSRSYHASTSQACRH